MRAFLVACAVAIVMAIGGAYILNEFQKPADMAVKFDSVRLPEQSRG